MCGSKTTKSTNTSSTQALGPYSQTFQSTLGKAEGLADNSVYNPAMDKQVAGFTDPQYAGFGAVQNNVGSYQPYLDQGGKAIDGATIAQYMNPYQQNVIDATQNQFNTQNARTAQGLNSGVAQKGAYGGSGQMVAQALQSEANQNAQNPVIAGLYQSGYNTAVQNAQSDANRMLTAGGLAQQWGLNDAGALLGIGGQQQAQNQSVLDAGSGNAAQRDAYGRDNLSWLANIAAGLSGSAGSTTTGSGTQTTPGPSALQTGLGLATSALGFFSDERVKENIEPVGQTFDGQTIHRYNYVGDPRQQIGLIAQEVEQAHPEAVGEVNGIKTVDYGAATNGAVRPGLAAGGAVGGGYNGYRISTNNTQGGAGPSLAQASGGAPAAPAPAAPAASNEFSDLMGKFQQGKEMMDGLGKLTQSATATQGPGGWETSVKPEGLAGFGNFLGSKLGFAEGGSVFDRNPLDDIAKLGSDVMSSPKEGVGAPLVAPTASGGMAPPTAAAAPAQGMGGLNVFGLSDPARQGLISAGLGMIGSESPNWFGQGGLQGMRAYTGAKDAMTQEAHQKQQMEQQAAELRQRQAEATERMRQSQAEFPLAQRLKAAQAAQAERALASPQGDLREVGGKLVRVDGNNVTELYGAGKSDADARIAEAVKLGYDPKSEAVRQYALTGVFPKENQQRITAIDKKFIEEADGMVMANQGVIDSLSKAKQVSDAANSGPLASERAWFGANFPSITPEAVSSEESGKATLELDNQVVSNALSQLKTIFGGNPTEGERKILLDMQGSSSLPKDVRLRLYDTAIRRAEKYKEYNQVKAAAMRSGDYYKPDFVMPIKDPKTDDSDIAAGYSGVAPPINGAAAAAKGAGGDGKWQVQEVKP